MAAQRMSGLSRGRRRAPAAALRRTRDPDGTAKRILAAGAALFARHGYDGVGIKQVASAAQVTIGALYHHFPGKDELYAAVTRQVFAAPASTFPAALVGPGPAEPRLRQVVEWFARIMIEDRQFSLLLKRELLDPRPSTPRLAGAELFERPLRLTQALVRELLPGANSEQAVSSLVALLFGLSHLKGIESLLPDAHRSLTTPREIAAFSTSLLLRGLAR
jgi:TetR/AcrR family transcriptional regulator